MIRCSFRYQAGRLNAHRTTTGIALEDLQLLGLASDRSGEGQASSAWELDRTRRDAVLRLLGSGRN